MYYVLTFLYIDPNYDFHISDPNDFMLILFFLMTSVIACSLTDRFQKQTIILKRMKVFLNNYIAYQKDY